VFVVIVDVDLSYCLVAQEMEAKQRKTICSDLYKQSTLWNNQGRTWNVRRNRERADTWNVLQVQSERRQE